MFETEIQITAHRSVGYRP